MKVLFNRFKSLFKRAHSKTKVKDPRDSRADPLSPSARSLQKKKLPSLPPLTEWPPPPPPLEQPRRDIGTQMSITSYKPLPELSSRTLEETPLHFGGYDPISISHSRSALSDVAEEDSVEIALFTRRASPRGDQDTAGRSSRKTGNGGITTTNGSNGVPKKVAFLPSPPNLSGRNADRPLPEDASTSYDNIVIRSQTSRLKDTHGSMYTVTPTTTPSSRPSASLTPNSCRTVETNSTTWSGCAEEDLVSCLGPRERTRQEVLWEIVKTEEKYVAELLKMKNTFIVPLLHPHATSLVSSPTMLERGDTSRLDTGVTPYQLPDDLRRCLEVIDSILAGHLKLSKAFRKRYNEQYPLVRSLADVFVANSHVLRGYTDYVLHLERALEQVNDMISTRNLTKRPKNKNVDEWLKVCTFLRKLEIDARDRGEDELAISLSKPFQKLLKYPLLFQNLLFHTDPSTFEYESTLRMVAEVENIVRSIEDEKIQKEERDNTRDILTRIEGLDKVKELAVPKPSRVLVGERILAPRGLSDASEPSSPPSVGTNKAMRGKTTFLRLSDVLQNGGGGVRGKKDMWLVEFNDVVLRCQRTGTTSLPLGSVHASSANFLPELQGKSKHATTRRNSTPRPRNLYKFIEIENWTLGNSVQPREGEVSVEEVVRSGSQIHSAVQQPKAVPIPDDDDQSISDRGADMIAFQRSSGCSREWADAKFGHRLDSAWDGSIRSPLISVRSNKAATQTPMAPPNKVASSPAPSEDSGVGLYRQMVNDSDLSPNND